MLCETLTSWVRILFLCKNIMMSEMLTQCVHLRALQGILYTVHESLGGGFGETLFQHENVDCVDNEGYQCGSSTRVKPDGSRPSIRSVSG